MHLSVKFIFLSICLVGTVSCTRSEAPLGKPVPSLSYNHLGAVRVSGGAVQVNKPEVRPVSDIGDFVADPYEVLSTYADRRFYQDSKLSPRMVFQINQAEIKKIIPTKTAFERLTFQEEEQYHLLIDISMFPISEKSKSSAPYGINIDRTLKLSENLSLSQKEFRQFEFIEKAMSDIDRAIMDIITNRIR